MKYRINLKKIFSIDEIEQAWSGSDYVELLKRFDYPDAEQSDTDELRELLFMAISDFEPTEAAEIILNYKFSDRLTEGQISQLSHEMMEDKVSEEYADISLHQDLFNINQLLYKAYNGKFPLTKATAIVFEMKSNDNQKPVITKENVLKAFNHSFSERSVIKRLFAEALAGKTSFEEAEHIIWDLKNVSDSIHRLITSEYWIEKEDFIITEFECTVIDFEEVEQD